MANSKKTELATVGSFELTVNRFEGLSPEDLEELKDQMEDLDQDTGIACRLIKIPSGGKLAYEVQTGEDETDVDYMKEVEGVIIFTHRLNGYWPGAFGTDDNKVPACSSMDGKTAVWTDTGEVRTCENCPLNQYGSDDNPNGTGKGKACKNMRRIYLMMNGDPNFYLLTVPPPYLHQGRKQAAYQNHHRGDPLHRPYRFLQVGEGQKRQGRRVQQGHGREEGPPAPRHFRRR